MLSETLSLTAFVRSMTFTGVDEATHRRRRHLWENWPTDADAVRAMLREMPTSPFHAV
jgi:hypothetical protein